MNYAVFDGTCDLLQHSLRDTEVCTGTFSLLRNSVVSMKGKGEMQDYLPQEGERDTQLAFLVWDLVCILSSFNGERKGHSFIIKRQVSCVLSELCC